MFDQSTYLARLERVEKIAQALEDRSFSGPWGKHAEEPRVRDMLSDPIVRLVMKRDGVVASDVLAIIKSLQVTLG